MTHDGSQRERRGPAPPAPRGEAAPTSPPSRMTLNRSHLFWILNAAAWLLFACIDILLDYRVSFGDRRMVVFHAMAFGSGFAVTVALRYIYRATYRSSPALSRNIITVFIASLLAAHVWELCIFLCAVTIDPRSSLRTLDIVHGWFRGEWLQYFNAIWEQWWPFLAWSIAYYALHIWLENRQERLRSERAEQMARQAQLDALRYQVNPHFLFNSLNAVRAMITENPETARQMTTDLAAFFRQTLTRTDRTTLPLREEIGVVSRYLAIEELRFEERLQLTIEVAPEVEELLVPYFTIQPLVENAIKHGMRTSPSPLRVGIHCRYDDDALEIEVTNSGSWSQPPADGSTSTGSGIENLRERLAHHYGDRCRLRWQEDDDSVRVTIRITHPETQEG